MADQNFKSWDSHVREKMRRHGDKSSESRSVVEKQILNPDPVEFLEYCEKECHRVFQVNRRILKLGDDLERYKMVSDLYDAANQCRVALEEENSDGIAKAFLRLGRLAEAMTRFTKKQRLEINDSLRRDKRRLAGLRSRNYGIKMLKDYACNLAREKWAEDHDQTIRLREMCDLVWHDMIVDPKVRAKLPNNEEGLKSWLRPTAKLYAPWAIKPGRPRNTRNK